MYTTYRFEWENNTMYDRQTSDCRTLRATRTRGFSAARRVLVAMGLGLWTVACAAGAQSGGQSAASNDYSKMATQTFSDEQWLQILRQRVHQPMSVWYGVGTGTIEQTGTSFSSSGLNFENSRSGVLEKQLRQNGLMAKQPLAFLPLFDDRDPETVLTGAAVYSMAQIYGDVTPQSLDKAVGAQIAAAVREKLLTHRDVRVRAVAIAILGDTKWMMPEDIAKGLDDQTNEIRILTMGHVSMVRSKWSWESDPDNTDEPNTPDRLTRDQFRQRDAQLAEILLAHLNDTHYYIRENAGDILSSIFMRRVVEWQEENPGKKPIERPRSFDWVRSEWQRRVTTQKAWANWWKQNGDPKPKTP
jgi:hypothetical protein